MDIRNPDISSYDEAGRAWSAKYVNRDDFKAAKGPLEWWYRFTAPPVPPPTASLEQRELARRGRLTSLVLFIIVLISFGLALPVAIFQNHLLLIVVAVLCVLICGSLWFNRRGQIAIAGTIVVCSVSVGIPFAVITAPGGLGTNSVFLYDMMLQSELIAVSLLPAWTVFLLAACNCTFIILDFNLQPHTSDLNALLAKAGPEVLARPIVLHIIAAVVTYLWVRSAMQAIKRADRAEVIALLEHDIAEQANAIAQQKQQLDASIQKILNTLMHVANGSLDARVPLTPENTLWQVAGALNNLLSRFQRLRQVESRLQFLEPRLQQASRIEHEIIHTRKEIERQLHMLHESKSNGLPLRLSPTGTALDPLLKELHGYVLIPALPPSEGEKIGVNEPDNSLRPGRSSFTPDPDPTSSLNRRAWKQLNG